MLRMPKVWLTLAHYFQLDERLTRGWWLALMHSKWSEPVAWRNALVLYDRTETPLRTPDSVFAFLQSACPPQKVGFFAYPPVEVYFRNTCVA